MKTTSKEDYIVTKTQDKNFQPFTMFHNTGSHPGPPTPHSQHALHPQSSPHCTLGSRRPLQKTPQRFFFCACAGNTPTQQRTRVEDVGRNMRMLPSHLS